VALLELDRPSEAITYLQDAIRLDPDDAEYRSKLATGLFRACRFEEARDQAINAVTDDDRLAEAHWLLALIAERSAETAEAEKRFELATALDAERFPRATRLSRESFEGHVAAAIDRLPADYRKYLDRIAVTVEDLPATEVLLDENPPLDAEALLGLFVGVPLGDQESGAPAELPPRILIFKKNLERLALNDEELIEEIGVTLYHELGHYLGLDEEELESLDLC
jgi:predicted Zn-dependent protease with MMP-like domain